MGSVRVPRAGVRSWPFAVGLVQSEESGEQSSADVGPWRRLAVAVAAYTAGYYLIDVVQVDARTGVTPQDLARLWAAVVRADAEGVFVLGLDDDARTVLDPLADELRLTVRVVPADGDEDPSPDPDAAPATEAGQRLLPGDPTWDPRTLGTGVDEIGGRGRR